jgi:hypothetical protein
MAIVAQTRTKSKARRSGSSSGGSRSSSSKSNGSSRTRAKGKASQKSTSASNGVAESIKHSAGEVAPLARKAKVPLLASGAALAGVAGAIVATRSGRRRKVLGISVPKGVSMSKVNGMKPDAKKISGAVVDAAKRADRFGQRVSRVASSVRDVGETANEAAKKT